MVDFSWSLFTGDSVQSHGSFVSLKLAEIIQEPETYFVQKNNLFEIRLGYYQEASAECKNELAGLREVFIVCHLGKCVLTNISTMVHFTIVSQPRFEEHQFVHFFITSNE